MQKLGSAILVFAFLAFQSDSRACASPYSGPEYDRQLNVTLVDQANRKYRIEFPLTLNDTPFYKAALLYWPIERNPGTKQKYLEIAVQMDGGKYVGEFIAPDLSALTDAEVTVAFEHPLGGCGTYATRKLDESGT